MQILSVMLILPVDGALWSNLLRVLRLGSVCRKITMGRWRGSTHVWCFPGYKPTGTLASLRDNHANGSMLQLHIAVVLVGVSQILIGIRFTCFKQIVLFPGYSMSYIFKIILSAPVNFSGFLPRFNKIPTLCDLGKLTLDCSDYCERASSAQWG